MRQPGEPWRRPPDGTPLRLAPLLQSSDRSDPPAWAFLVILDGLDFCPLGFRVPDFGTFFFWLCFHGRIGGIPSPRSPISFIDDPVCRKIRFISSPPSRPLSLHVPISRGPQEKKSLKQCLWPYCTKRNTGCMILLSKTVRHQLSVNENSHFSSPFPTAINHPYFLFNSWRLSSPTAGATIIVRALEVSGRLSLRLLVLFPETQHVVRNASEATLEAGAFRRCHAGCMWGGRAPSTKKCLRK